MLPSKRYLWKTSTLIILFSIITSIILFSTIVSTISNNLGKKIERVQQEQFNKDVEAIKNSMVLDPTLRSLNSFTQKGYKIFVFDQLNGYYIYPRGIDSNLSFPSSDLSAIQITGGYFTDVILEDKKITISYPIQLKAPEITTIIIQSLPSLLGIVLITVLIMVVLYVTLYKHEKRKLDQLFILTQSKTPSAIINRQDFNIRMKDYVVIEKQVKDLYFSLENSHEKIKKEMMLVKDLERTNMSLLQGITHEMKTPLMSTKLLIEDFQRKEPGNELIPTVIQQLTNLEKLIHETLFVTQRKHLSKNKNTASVDIILKKVLQNYEVLLQDKNLVVEVSHNDVFMINIDEKLTEKILSNLLSNAIHYTEENTIISIKIETNSFKVMNFFDNKSLINVDEIGKPFISYGNNGGTGLGLYLIKTMLLNSPYELSVTIYEKNVFVAEITTMS